jgi:hypothetical protein
MATDDEFEDAVQSLHSDIRASLEGFPAALGEESDNAKCRVMREATRLCQSALAEAESARDTSSALADRREHARQAGMSLAKAAELMEALHPELLETWDAQQREDGA